jgi:hypothetical protein
MGTNAGLVASDYLTMLAFVVVSAVLILAPPSVAAWRSRIVPGAGWRGWAGTLGSLIAPALLAYLFVILAWLPAYNGQCGGWLGETQPCHSFGQYVGETMLWAAMSMALPALGGLLLGIAVLALRVLRRRDTGPTP